jgi:hypothetical protein
MNCHGCPNANNGNCPFASPEAFEEFLEEMAFVGAFLSFMSVLLDDESEAAEPDIHNSLLEGRIADIRSHEAKTPEYSAA